MKNISRLLIKPNTFSIYRYQKNQNPYIDIDYRVSMDNVMSQHKKLVDVLSNKNCHFIENPKHNLPDIVFTANAGLSLPRIKNTIILPHMKYQQRKEELEYLEKIFQSIKINTIKFPGCNLAPFEGQAELKWFDNGSKAICGYGHRATKETFKRMKKLLNNIYMNNFLSPPELLIVPLETSDYYHLDVAMLEYDDSKCIIHKKAFNNDSIYKIKKFLGEENVYELETKDKMCLNAFVDETNLITHKITDENAKKILEKLTKRNIKEIDTSEFEKSGGSVRCMVLDLY